MGWENTMRNLIKVGVLAAMVTGVSAIVPAQAQDDGAMYHHRMHRMMRHEMHREMRHRMMRHEMRREMRHHMMHRMMRREMHNG